MVDFSKLLHEPTPCATCEPAGLCTDHEPQTPCACGEPLHSAATSSLRWAPCEHCTVSGCQGACLAPHLGGPKLWTIGMSHYEGSDRVYISRNGATDGIIFAPSWPLVGSERAIRHAGGASAATWAEFTRQYTDEMRTSWEANRAAWRAMLARPSIVLQCPWCPEPERCHRSILAAILVKCGAKYIGEKSAT